MHNHSNLKANWPIALWLFVIGSLTSLDVQIVGRVTIAEILAFASLPILFFGRKVIFWNKNFVICFSILTLMFVSTIIADHINGFYLQLTARAVARPVFILGFLIFFVLVFERAPRAVVWFIYGLVIAGIINYFRPSAFESESAQDASTYGGIVFRVEPLVYAVVLAATTWAWIRSRWIAVASVFAAIIVLAALGSSRSSLLIYVMALFLFVTLLVMNPTGRKHFSLSRNRLVGLSLSCAGALILVYLGYITLAPAGMLGEDQRSKFEIQSATTLGTSPLGFVLGGRPQVYGAILGIMDRPILGFGSWRHDLTSVYVLDAFADVGTDPKIIDNIAKTGAVPGAGHSILLQTWVENGLVPATCWIYLAVIMFKVFLFNIKNNTIYTAFLSISFIVFTWSFLFSPPPVFLRYLTGMYMAYYVVFMDKHHPLRNARELI